MIVQNVSEDGKQTDITFTVPEGDRLRAIQLPYVRLLAGDVRTCGLRAFGSLMCWGRTLLRDNPFECEDDERNVCGGCFPLVGEPGDACGACGDIYFQSASTCTGSCCDTDVTDSNGPGTCPCRCCEKAACFWRCRPNSNRIQFDLSSLLLTAPIDAHLDPALLQTPSSSIGLLQIQRYESSKDLCSRLSRYLT